MKANDMTKPAFLVNPEGKLQFALEKDSSAEYLVLQNAADAPREVSWDITLPEGASLKLVFLTLEGTVSNHIQVSLCGRKAACELSGLNLASDTGRQDCDIRMLHLVPDCHSDQLFKNIVTDQAVTHFDGLVKVVPDAQHTEAYQANHNLLISEQARAYTRPQLEIYADEVKCSHGATIGRLNADELFYMRSRGIPMAEARLLQQMAFAGEVVGRISSPQQREQMLELVEKRLRSAFSNCQNILNLCQ